MRRFPAMLMAASLAATPVSAAAGPSEKSEDRSVEMSDRFEWSSGRSHLGVMVMGLTPELRKHFGARASRGASYMVSHSKWETSSVTAAHVPGEALPTTSPILR